ncbi:hypothetical protein Pelo_4541 [Pelomyxa schiedti]|nr:hypothetical protein Pelo_4541 [Pelomyxa schiedti]
MATASAGSEVGRWEWFDAVYQGDIDTMRVLLDGDRGLLNSVDDKQQRVTALHAATWRGNERCVEFLLSMGVDVNSQIGNPVFTDFLLSLLLAFLASCV